MGVALTNQQALDAIVAVETLQQAQAKGSFKLKCARALAKLREEGKLIGEHVEQLRDAHLERDAEGKPVPRLINGRVIEGSVTFKDDKAFLKAYEELMSGKLEVEVPTFTEAELENLEVPGSLEGLLPLIQG